jgi:hypothetical protein
VQPLALRQTNETGAQVSLREYTPEEAKAGPCRERHGAGDCLHFDVHLRPADAVADAAGADADGN